MQPTTIVETVTATTSYFFVGFVQRSANKPTERRPSHHGFRAHPITDGTSAAMPRPPRASSDRQNFNYVTHRLPYASNNRQNVNRYIRNVSRYIPLFFLEPVTDGTTSSTSRFSCAANCRGTQHWPLHTPSIRYLVLFSEVQRPMERQTIGPAFRQ